ncbi:MAG: pilus assembly protein PilM [Planctomycetes bacterium]|nr:pilus assembly protein PilM [Planctomycetota bacterium]
MIGVGLELGANVIKIAVVEKRGQATKIRDFEVHKIDAKKGDTEDDVVSVVDDALKRLKAPRGEVVASVRAQDCMIREILVPFTDEEKIRKTVKYQAENYFTTASIDDLIIEYLKFAEADTKSKLLVAGIKKSHIARRLSFLDECGVDPRAIDLDVAALYNACKHAGVFEEQPAALVIDIEADTLKIAVVEEGRLRLARALRMRVNKASLQKARGGKGESGIYDTAADESQRLPVVILDDGEDDAFSLEDSGISEVEREGIIHRIFMEIDRTVASVNLGHDVDLIALTGPSCALEGIADLFSEHFEIPARRLDFAEFFGGEKGARKGGAALEGGTAIGLALKALGVDHAGMDFRQEEFGYQGTFDQLKRGLACTLTLLFALTFLYAFALKEQLHQKDEALGAVQDLQGSLYTVLFPSLYDTEFDHMELRESTYHGSLIAEQELLQQRFEGSDDDDAAVVSSLEILRRFSAAKAKLGQRWEIQVENVRINPRKHQQNTFRCSSPQPAAATAMAQALEGDDLLTVAPPQTQFDKRRNRTVFTLVLKIRDDLEEE